MFESFYTFLYGLVSSVSLGFQQRTREEVALGEQVSTFWFQRITCVLGKQAFLNILHMWVRIYSSRGVHIEHFLGALYHAMHFVWMAQSH